MNEPIPGFLDAERAVYDALLAAPRPLINAGRLVQLNYLGKGKYSPQLDVLEIPYIVGNENVAPTREIVFVEREGLLERLGRTRMVFLGLLKPGRGVNFAALLRNAKISFKQCGDLRFIRRADALSIETKFKLLRCAAPAKAPAPAPAPPLLSPEVEAVKEALEELRRQTVGAHRILFNELRHQRAGLDRLLAELGLAGIAPETDPPCSPASAHPAA
ncbi:MAG: hypothetical protein F9K32_20360 [Desulfobulbaceae bacterium]|nr:MAG: hypothetical protein F9K32_20360 [Desulfobulbaceae bacterium]